MIRLRRKLARGFTLIEVLIGVGILAVMIGALLSYFLGTSRHAARVEGNLREALLAQIIVERLRDFVEVNPCYLARNCDATTGKAEFWGSVGHPPALFLNTSSWL